MREAMRKYKIVLGACGGRVLSTPIIRAHSPEEAVKKYLGEQAAPEQISEFVRYTREYTGKAKA